MMHASLLITHHAELIRFAHQLAEAAGDAIRPYFGAHGVVEEKHDHSPVTIADRAAEQAMRALIAARYPEHEIYGEEFGQQVGAGSWVLGPGTHPSNTQHPAPSTYLWVIDRIDGTRAFIAGRKEWGTLIALCENGIPILGILDQPITGERWLGVRGMKTIYSASSRLHAGIPRHAHETISGDPSIRRDDGMTIRTRPCTTLALASISSTYCAPPDDARYAQLARQCNEQITAGDCYAYGLLAKGERDIVCDTALKPYDILALVPIIEGAGGKIMGWDGEPVTLDHYREVVAVGDGQLHKEALRYLSTI